MVSSHASPECSPTPQKVTSFDTVACAAACGKALAHAALNPVMTLSGARHNSNGFPNFMAMSQVIDLTGSPSSPQRPRKKKRRGTEGAAAAAAAAGKGEVWSRRQRLDRVLAVLPQVDAASAQSALDCRKLLDDDAAVQETLLFLMGDVTDGELAARTAAEESSAACREDGELAKALAVQDAAAAAQRAPFSFPFDAERTGDDGSIMRELTACLVRDVGAGGRAYACSHVTMFASSRGFDEGWGCGYRNAQMLLSHLLARRRESSICSHSSSQGPSRPYCSRLFAGAGSVPSVETLQSLIEEAWASGFDAPGAAQLRGRLLGTRTWIGATEVAVLLRSQGVRAHIIDFSSLMPPHADNLFRWVWDYFEQGRSQPARAAAAGGAARGGAVFQSMRAPLYLQHQGHSRLIVGAVRKSGKEQLLILDPGACPDELMAALSTRSDWQTTCAFSMESFKIRQYQLVEVQDDALGFNTATAGGGSGGGGGGRGSGGGSGGRREGSGAGHQLCSIFMDPREMEAAKVIAAKERIGKGF